MTTRVTLAALMAVAAIAVACGSDSSASEDGGGPEVTITSPSDGAELTTPFTVEVSSSEEIGPEESGKDHVHLFFDGDDSEYEVVTSNSVEVEELAPGEHTINVSLRHADHSPAGAEAEVSVTVAEGDGSDGEQEPSSSDDDGYDY